MVFVLTRNDALAGARRMAPARRKMINHRDKPFAVRSCVPSAGSPPIVRIPVAGFGPFHSNSKFLTESAYSAEITRQAATRKVRLYLKHPASG